MKRILLIFAVFFVTVAGIYYWRQTHLQTTSDSISTPRVTTPSATKPEPTEPPLLPSNLESITTNNVTVPLDVVPGSYTALVSRDYLLPSTYVPKGLVEISVRFSSNSHDDKRKMRRVASKALSKMFRAAEKKGIILYGVTSDSGIRMRVTLRVRNTQKLPMVFVVLPASAFMMPAMAAMPQAAVTNWNSMMTNSCVKYDRPVSPL